MDYSALREALGSREDSPMSSNDRVIIFDTTLRDGEQSPGASMTGEEKLRIARALERLKVDVIEAGFAIASPGDFAAVKLVADNIKDSTVCSLARAVDADIERAAEALAGANSGRIHTFIATSPIHMQYKLRMQPDQVVEQAVRAVKKARSLCADVEFSCEDAGRSEIDFLCRIIEAAIDAGARTINIPDTVGYAIPHQYADTIRQLLERIPNADKAVFSVHCHNDLGLAVANSLAAVVAGARQVECTINGLGERAGNAALEECALALKHLHGIDCGIDVRGIPSISALVEQASGRQVAWQKSVVGAGVFTHEAGIHVDGLLKHRRNYEGLNPDELGRSHSLVLGKHSGAHMVELSYRELGIELQQWQSRALLGCIRRFSTQTKRSPQSADLQGFYQQLCEQGLALAGGAA